MNKFWKSRPFIMVAVALGVTVIVVSGLIWWNFGARRATEPVPSITTVAANLEVPWALDFLPDGGIIFTERPGRVRIVDSAGVLLPEPLLTIAEVAHRGEGGLLGIALHPSFDANRLVYVYYTYEEGDELKNKVVRYRMQGGSLTRPEETIAGIPGASIHNGGRIRFGPDGLLYITTGDAANSASAPDTGSLAGKILRLNPDGSIPADNPISGSAVYSLGHRNPQGLAWDDAGRLWATEHGSSGADELNLIEPGKDYGWPGVRGDETAPGLQSPVTHSGSDTWAPSGVAFLDGSLFFGGLRSQSLFEARINNGTVSLYGHLQGQFGRLRAVAAGPGGYLYVTTSNRDGRGLPLTEDDRVLRIDPRHLEQSRATD